MPSLEAVSLSKRYGTLVALASLNLKLQGSKCVGFLGPNGAGKTTTLKIFSDMIRASEGEAYINGVEIKANKRLALASCGVLVETPEIYPALTAREALSMFAEIKGVPKGKRSERVNEVVAEVRMEDWIDGKVGKFSKGMKQRINIAAALIGDPEILILDEPTSGLDPRGMAEVREILKSLKRRNKLIFMSSHLLNEVTDICDEVALINKGRLLLYDSVMNVVTRNADAEVEFEVQFSRPVDKSAISSALAPIKSVRSIKEIDSRTLSISFSGGNSAQEAIVSELASMNIGLLNFRASNSTITALEDVYLSLIKEVT